MNDRPTPETDSAMKYWPCEKMELVDSAFARRLERERDEAREAIHIAESLIKPQIEREQLTPEARPDNDEQRDLTALLRLLREVRRERDEAREEAEYWKEAAKVPSGIFRSLEMARDQAKRDAEYYRARYEKLKDEREAAK